jgi:hypothetical protein
MKYSLFPIFPIMLFFVFTQISFAGIKLDFNSTNQTYDWLTIIDHSLTRKGFDFKSSFNGESNLVKGSINRWQENATASFIAEKSLIPRLSFVSGADYTINGLEKRRVRSSSLQAGISYHPVDFFEFRPTIRIERIKRSDFDEKQNDRGTGYNIQGNFTAPRIMGINMASTLSYDNADLTNIPSNEGNAALSLTSNIRSSDTVSISLKGTEAAKKYYGSNGGNVIKQIRQERESIFAVSVALPAALRLRVDADAHLSRYLYRYQGLEETTAPQRDNYARSGGYKAGIIGKINKIASGLLSYRWGKSGQDYEGVDLDQNTDLGELSFQGKLMLSRRDSLSADFVFGVTSYSNPSAGSAHQDRDQKVMLANGKYCHVFSRYFSAGISGGANSFHQIYVSGYQSANNNRNDTYIFSPNGTWKPFEHIAVSQSFDIQANYITFDFDRKKIATRNRIFRRATSKTDLLLLLSKRLVLEQAYQYRYEDYGQLIWNDGWQQAVSWDRRRNGLETRLIYNPNKIFQITPSFAWERTNDFKHSVEVNDINEALTEIRSLSDQQVKMLVEVELIFKWAQTRRLRADFSHRVRTFMERPRELIDYATLTLEYMF